MPNTTQRAKRTPQADRTALAEERMLEAAVRLMAERGYEKTTLAAIAQAAGYSRGLPHHHFGSKADLFAEVIRRISRRVDEEFQREVGDRTGLDALLTFVDGHRRFAERSPEIMRALQVLWFQSLIAESNLRATAIDDLLGHRKQVRQMIQEGVEAGNIRDGTDADIEAVQFCGTLFGLTLQWLIDPDGSPIDEMHRSFKQRLVATLSA